MTDIIKTDANVVALRSQATLANPPERVEVWSCGGGTQSAAIAALIILGKLPRPTVSVIADTEREKQSTWDYMDNVLNPNLAAVGVEIVRVPRSAWMTENDPDVLTNWGSPGVLIPAFKLNEGAEEGRNPGMCSDRWKKRIVQRYLRSIGIRDCNIWLGISGDELRRVRASREAWYQNRFPLVFDVPMRRSECISLVMDVMGWPEPPRSSCWMCPNHDDNEWGRIKTQFPEEFQKACVFEIYMQKHRPDFYLHRSCKPLGEIDFDDKQMSLLDGACSSGYCFT